MDTQSSDTPSQGEDELISESDILAQIPTPTESEKWFIADFMVTAGTLNTVSFRTRSQSQRESESKSIIEAFFNVVFH